MKYQKTYLEQFPAQIEFALSNYIRHNIDIDHISSIVLGGLGGSGIAGRIVKSFFEQTCPVPIEVISDYSLPSYVDDRTLVILSSYSGNTEETLSMYIDAMEKRANMLVVTTGGLLHDLAIENNIQIYVAEKGFQPRMALGYSLTYLVLIFSELLSQNQMNNVKSILPRLKNYDYIIKQTKSFFAKIKTEKNKKFVIVTDSPSYPIGLRFAQQLQENAKLEAFIHELPEANHNVIESYYSNLNSVFFFINSMQNDKLTYRFEFLKQLLEGYNHCICEITMPGFALRDIYENIYMLDWLSLLIADHNHIKSDEIKNINGLKAFLQNK